MGWKDAPGMFVDVSRQPHIASFLTDNAMINTFFIAIFSILLVCKLTRSRSNMILPPGPPGFPLARNWLQFRDGLNPRNLSAIAKKYGDIFLLRMGQRNVVVISSPEMAREVLQTQGIEFGSRTRNIVFEMTTGKGSDMVFADYGEHWRKMRRIATLPFFTNKVVLQFRDAWEEEITLAIRDIGTLEGATTTGIVIWNRLQLMMYNIVYIMMFGMRFQSEDDPLYVQLMSLNHENNRLSQSFKYNYGDFIPSLKPLLRGYLKKVCEANQRRLKFLKDAFLDKRRKAGAREKIGVDYFVDAETKGEISEVNVLYLIQNMNVAAIETSLWSSEWAVAELVNNPSIQRKVREELDSVLGEGILLTEKHITSLPYLQAFVKEILRKHMVIPMLVPHANLQDAKLGGYDIPAGSRVLVNAWGIANDPRYWVKPEEFRPERFVEEAAKVEANGADFRFIPFGSGRRSCPGSVIALPVLALVVGRLLQAYEVAVAPALAVAAPGMEEVPMEEAGGQLALILANHSKVVVKPRIIGK